MFVDNTIKYKGSGWYRFINTLENNIYIGSAKNIHARLNQHFSNKESSVRKEAYKSKCSSFLVR